MHKPENVNQKQTDRERIKKSLKEIYPTGALDKLERIIGVEVKNLTRNGLF